MFKKIFNLTLCSIIFFITSINYAYSFSIAGKLSIEGIKKLAALGKTTGSKSVGQELRRLSKGLSVDEEKVFLTSSYLKILVEQGRLGARESEEFLQHLKNVPGFKEALSKMCGISDAKAIGHGFEVRTANSLAKKGYEIKGIGVQFKDGIKSAPTDIDIIAEKGGKQFIFELKKYSSNNIDYNALINFRGDMQSLNAYVKQHKNVKSFFVISSQPTDPAIQKLLEATAKSQNVKLLSDVDSNTIPSLLESLK